MTTATQPECDTCHSFLLTMHWTLRTVHVQNHSPVWSVSHGQLHPLGIHQGQPL